MIFKINFKVNILIRFCLFKHNHFNSLSKSFRKNILNKLKVAINNANKQ